MKTFRNQGWLQWTLCLSCTVFLTPACGDELDETAGIEATEQEDVQALSSWDPGRGPAFLKLVRQLNADGSGSREEASHLQHTCVGNRTGQHQYGNAYRISCTGPGGEKKSGLLFLFIGTQSWQEFCAQGVSLTQSYFRFPWQPQGDTTLVATLLNWTNRLASVSDFVVAQTKAYRATSGTAVQDPVIFAGHSKGGIVAQLFGFARASIETDTGFDGPFHQRYTTVISFNAPKPSQRNDVAALYKSTAYSTVRRYKPVWIERANDVIPRLPTSWPARSKNQFSRYRTKPAADLHHHRLYQYTDQEMVDAANALQLDPWGGKPRQGFFGEADDNHTCSDPGDEL
ncbi:MAG: hypothetical protein AAFU77_10920 [Myxococcota bacterium]